MVETTWIYRYLFTTNIKYDLGSGFLGYDLNIFVIYY